MNSRTKIKGNIAVPHPPGPKTVNALSNLRSFQRNPLNFLLGLDAQFGGVVRFSTGLLPVYLVSDPNAVKHVLQDNYQNYNKNTFTYSMARRILGENLLTSDGSDWLQRRRLLQPLFHRKYLSRFVQSMVTIIEETVEQWREAKDPLNLIDEMMRITLRIAGKTLFSLDLDAESTAIRSALNTTTDEVFNQFRSPLAILWTLFNFPTPNSRRFQQAQMRLNDLLYYMIRERRATQERPYDVLSLLLDAVDTSGDQQFTDDTIRNEIGAMLTAGHETTAISLTWIWILLSTRLDVEQRIQAESDGYSIELEDFEPSTRLPYTNAVFAEALRLYPPVWGFSRRAMTDDVINGYHIPAGARIMLSPWVTHHSERYWPDPNLFVPTRFLDTSESNIKSMAYFPFGMGPRMCIGNRFAQMEVLLILTFILRRYHLEIIDKHPIELSTQGTLRPLPPLRFRLVDR